MLRALLAACALLCMPARAQDYTPNEAPIARATANVMIQALAPSDYGDWAYRWDAVSIRVSRFVHWHIYEPDARDRPADAIVRRNGWIDVDGANTGVSAYGPDDHVDQLSFEFRTFNTLDLIAALRAQGAAVSFQADYESYAEYIITPPGRRAGLLTTRQICTSPQSRAAERCHYELTLAFEAPE